jgi:hypothetical protein
MEQLNNGVMLEVKCSIAVHCSIARLSQDEMRLYYYMAPCGKGQGETRGVAHPAPRPPVRRDCACDVFTPVVKGIEEAGVLPVDHDPD